MPPVLTHAWWKHPPQRGTAVDAARARRPGSFSLARPSPPFHGAGSSARSGFGHMTRAFASQRANERGSGTAREAGPAWDGGAVRGGLLALLALRLWVWAPEVFTVSSGRQGFIRLTCREGGHV